MNTIKVLVLAALTSTAFAGGTPNADQDTRNPFAGKPGKEVSEPYYKPPQKKINKRPPCPRK